MSSRATPETVRRGVLTALLACLAIAWILPVGLMVNNAAKSTPEYTTGSPLEPASSITALLDNFATVLKAPGVAGGISASITYAVGGSLLGLAAAALAAFAIVRLPIRHRFAWLVFGLAGIMFPVQMYLIPLFVGYRAVGLYDTQLGLLLFHSATVVPFSLFVLRGYFSTIPAEYEEAARIDGAGHLRVFRAIYLPLGVAPLAVLFLLQSTWIWNELVFGLILSISPGVRPVTAGLAGLQDLYAATGPPIALAGAVLASAPTLVLFLILARQMMSGLAVTGPRAR